MEFLKRGSLKKIQKKIKKKQKAKNQVLKIEFLELVRISKMSFSYRLVLCLCVSSLFLAFSLYVLSLFLLIILKGFYHWTWQITKFTIKLNIITHDGFTLLQISLAKSCITCGSKQTNNYVHNQTSFQIHRSFVALIEKWRTLFGQKNIIRP